MKQGTLAVSLLCTLAIAAYFLLPQFSSSQDSQGIPSKVRSARRDTPEQPAIDTTSQASRQALPEQARTETQSRIVGRCVSRASSTPLAGCVVALRGLARNRADRSKPAARAWKDPAAVTTGEDGRFELVFDPPETHRFSLEIACSSHAVMQSRWNEIETGAILDLGDIVLPTGARIRGRTVDRNGQPVGGVRVELRRDSPVPDSKGTSVPRSFVIVSSRADGSLSSDEVALPGKSTIHIRSEHVLVRPTEVHVDEGQAFVTLDIVVKRPSELPSISGTVVDEAGRPVSGIDLAARADKYEGIGRDTGASDNDGRFVIRRRRATGDIAYLGFRLGTHRGYQMIEPLEPVAWGARDVRVVVRLGGTVTITVVEAATGKPVEDYFVRCFPINSGSSLDRRNKATGRHDNGVARLDGIPAGKNRLLVFPTADRLVASEPIDFELGPGGTAIPVRIQKRIARTIRVVLRDGTPVAGSVVEVLRPQGEGQLELHTISGTPEEAYTRIHASFLAVVLDRGVTRANGEVILHGPPSSGTLAIKARGPGHVAALETAVSIQPDLPPLVIRVAKGATLKGSVGPAQVLARFAPPEAVLDYAEKLGTRKQAYLSLFVPSIAFREIGGQQRTIPGVHDPKLTLDDAGRFRIDGIPPGAYRAVFHFYVSSGGSRGSFDQLDLAAVTEVRDGEERELRLDISSLVPGRLVGRILVDGRPYVNGEFTIRGTKAPDSEGRTSVGAPKNTRTDDAGGFELELRGGADYSISLVVDGTISKQRARIRCTPTVAIVAGQVKQVVFELTRRRLELEVLASDGKTPIANRAFTVSAPDYKQIGSPRFGPVLTSDDKGRLILDPAPPGPIRLFTWPDRLATPDSRTKLMRTDPFRLYNARIPFDPIEVPSQPRHPKLSIRMPAGTGH